MQIFKFIVVCLILCAMCKCAAQIIDSNAETSTTQIILNDIRNAFKVVTNNSRILNRIIPVMYQSSIRQENSMFMFKVPKENAESSVNANKDLATSYSMLILQRSEFVEPTFPNLTIQHMRAQLNKRRHQHSTSKPNFNVREQAAMSNLNRQPDDWSLLGLEGWTGAISPAADTLGVTKSTIMDKEYPTSDILMDFVEDTSTVAQHVVTSIDSDEATERVAEAQDITENGDANIYIARVNDPFAYSVKWELRNATNTSTSDDRTKRDVVKLYSMIQCSTGCNPLIYKAYGCFCGFLGAGLPVDGIDRCCKLHDKCYDNSNCIAYLQYFVPYIWKCYRGKPLCAIDHGEWGGPDSCAARLCYCDLRLSRCLRKFTCPRRRAVCTTSSARRLQNFLLAF